MKGKLLLTWIIFLNIFDSSVCLTNVWLHKLVFQRDEPVYCSPQNIWKIRLRIQQFNNRSGLQRDIWQKAEAKLCSNQMVTFGIMLFTTENCTLLSSYPITLSLYLFERQSVGNLDLEKNWNFHLPVDCHSLKTVLTIGEAIGLNGARIHVGYENELRQSDGRLNKGPHQPLLTDAILQRESQLFQNGARHSKRFADNISPKENYTRKGKTLRGDNKLFLEPFSKSNSELNYTQFDLLKKKMKLRRKFLQSVFLVDDKSTQKTREINDAKNMFNTLNEDETSLRIRRLGKALTDGDQSTHLNNKENIPNKESIDSSSSIIHLFNTKYFSSTPSVPFYSTSTDDKIFFIPSSTRMPSNTKSNFKTDLPFVEYSRRLTLKQEKETALPNTKPSVSSHETVTLKMASFKTSTTVGMKKRTSEKQGLSPFPPTGKVDMFTTTDLMPKESQNASASHKTTDNKDLMSTLKTSSANESSIMTISTLVESTIPSRRSTLKWRQTSSPKQVSTHETTRMSSANGSDEHSSSITTSLSKTSTPTKTTTPMTLLSSLPTTLKTSTITNKVTTSEFLTQSTHLLTASPTSDLWVTINSTNLMASTNESINSTLAGEITTFLPHHTDKNLVAEDEDDTYFWPVVLSLVIGIPAVIVFSIAMVVILRKRNIDSSTFFFGSAIGDEEV